MSQLVLTIIGIALTALLAVASINYLPWWHSRATEVERTMLRSFSLLERGFDAVGRALDGQPPAPTAAEDGGLMGHFGAVLGFRPAALAGYEWVYGQRPPNAEHLPGYFYFCMRPATAEARLDEGAWRGVQRARAGFSPDQIHVAPACGAYGSSAKGANAGRLAVTMYVTVFPGPGGLVR